MIVRDVDRLANVQLNKNYLALARAIVYGLNTRDAINSVDPTLAPYTNTAREGWNSMYSIEQIERWIIEHIELGSWKLVGEKEGMSMFAIAGTVARYRRCVRK